ncbi:hypothetical protein GF326_00805 [Candidatus Bathyarchaeota archaeon]|nr:hypothetical protein [Candidatus Bathyarchaeota archaeon]
MKLHKYKNFEEYKQVQEEGNIKKLHCVFANEKVIDEISKYIKWRIPNASFGICHGTRRGVEQQLFIEKTSAKVIGTEISSTATQFPNTIQWDFHDIKKEWEGAVDFVYSNALDHSYDPGHALSQWIKCLNNDGLCFIEYTKYSKMSSKLDPFGANLDEVKHLIEKIGDIVDTIEVKAKTNKKRKLLYTILVVKKRRPHYGLAPISAMKTKKFAGDNTLCQTLREIHETTNNEEIKLKCRQTMMMSKRLTYDAKRYKKIAKKKGLTVGD